MRPRHEVGASIPVVLGRGDYRGVRGVRGQGVQGGPPPTVQGRGTSRGVQRGQGLGGVRGAGTGNGNFENFRGDRGGGRGVRDQRLRPVANVQPLVGNNPRANWDVRRNGGNRSRGNQGGQRYR